MCCLQAFLYKKSSDNTLHSDFCKRTKLDDFYLFQTGVFKCLMCYECFEEEKKLSIHILQCRGSEPNKKEENFVTQLKIPVDNAGISDCTFMVI